MMLSAAPASPTNLHPSTPKEGQFQHTVFDSFVPANTEYHPYVVADPLHPKGYTVLTKQDAPQMHVDFIEHEKFFVFHADMPGFKKEDIHVVVGDGVLIIEARREQPEMESAPETVHHSERKLGRVCRSFRLPENASQIPQPEAKYVDGVLSINFLKKNAGTRRRVRVP